MITVEETDIKDILKVHPNIVEFDDPNAPASFFLERYQKEKHLVIAAYFNQEPIGYMIGYEKEANGSFYCWLAGVDYRYRRIGALTKMFDYFLEWSKKEGYQKITIKTRNDKRDMLSYLVKSGWNFTRIEEKENILNNGIYLVKEL